MAAAALVSSALVCGRSTGPTPTVFSTYTYYNGGDGCMSGALTGALPGSPSGACFHKH